MDSSRWTREKSIIAPSVKKYRVYTPIGGWKRGIIHRTEKNKNAFSFFVSLSPAKPRRKRDEKNRHKQKRVFWNAIFNKNEISKSKNDIPHAALKMDGYVFLNEAGTFDLAAKYFSHLIRRISKKVTLLSNQVKSIPCGSAHAEAQKKLSILWSDIVVASYRSSSTCQEAYWRQSYLKLFVVRSKCRTQDPIYCMSGYWKGSRVQRSYAYTCMHVRKLYKYISVQYKATNIKDQINRIIISGTFLEGKLR